MVEASCPAMMPVQQFIDRIGPTDGRVLITGETGTGKEVVAQALFAKAQQADMPRSCRSTAKALTQSLAESQLFGHKKGAYTGADRDHKGFLEVANGGTVFLDELGELDKHIQVKLLRFLESGEIQRLGESQPITVDVRVISATNKDLRRMIAEGQFREDLLFRLNMFHIHLPPLRDRREDIPDLAPAPARLRSQATRRERGSPADARGASGAGQPPVHGERARVVQRDGVRVDHLRRPADHAGAPAARDAAATRGRSGDDPDPAFPVSGSGPRRWPPAYAGTSTPTLPFPAPPGALGPGMASDPNAPTKSLADVEMEYILQVYAKNGMNKQKTSDELGISLKTLYNKLHKYEEERPSALPRVTHAASLVRWVAKLPRNSRPRDRARTSPEWYWMPPTRHARNAA